LAAHTRTVLLRLATPPTHARFIVTAIFAAAPIYWVLPATADPINTMLEFILQFPLSKVNAPTRGAPHGPTQDLYPCVIDQAGPSSSTRLSKRFNQQRCSDLLSSSEDRLRVNGVSYQLTPPSGACVASLASIASQITS
jgi:hypothetical protein